MQESLVEPSDRERPVVLVVDDEPEIRELLERQLEGDGLEVRHAGSVAEAWASVRERRPDVVLTDLRMPGEPGEALIESLHREEPQIRIIVMTGYPSLDSALTSLRSGVHEYLLKPFPDLRLVSNAVANALRMARLERDNERYRDRLEEGYRKLLEVETARNAVANLLAQEIREPLGELRLGLEVLEQALARGPSADAEELLGAARTQADRAFAVADRFAELELLKAGERFLGLEPCSLPGILAEARERQLALEENEGRGIHIEAGDGTPEIQGDPDLLRAVLESLLQVALLRTPAGGTVRAAVEAAEGNEVRCAITDPGPPPPEGFERTAFDVARGDEAGVELGGGMRLPFCKLAIEAMGGRIRAARTGDAGLTLEIALRSHGA